MPTALAQFKAAVAGKRGDLEDYIDIITASGDFGRITNFEVILNSWNNILLTPRNSYTFDPEYGSNLYKYVFEPADELTRESIVEEIYNSLMTYDDRAQIVSIDIQFLDNLKGFRADITVKYGSNKTTMTLTIDETSYFNFLRN